MGGITGQGGRGRFVAATAAALLLLLALVALSTGARHGGSGSPSARQPSSTVLSYAISTYLILGAATTAFLVFLLFRHREALPARKQRGELRRILIAVLVIAAISRLAGLPGLRHLVHHGGTPQHVQTAPQHQDTLPKGNPRATAAPHFTWLPVFVLAGLGVAGVAAYLVLRKQKPGFRVPQPTLAEEMSDALDEAVGDLRAEHDPRRAIIAAYARMERLLAAHGLPRRAFEAPFEYLARVLTELRASATSVFELTTLFERAKFSRHDLDAGLKEEAIVALETVRDELRQPA